MLLRQERKQLREFLDITSHRTDAHQTGQLFDSWLF
jgi:hypothetical protein